MFTYTGKKSDLVAAFRAGQRSQRTNVDADVAADRWARKNCEHAYDIMCGAEHAWWDGFANPTPAPTYVTDRVPGDTVYSWDGDGEWSPTLKANFDWQPMEDREGEHRTRVDEFDIWRIERPPYRWQGPGADASRFVVYVWQGDGSCPVAYLNANTERLADRLLTDWLEANR